MQTYRLLYSKKDKYAQTNTARMIDSSACTQYNLYSINLKRAQTYSIKETYVTQIQLELLTVLPVHSIIGIVSILRECKLTEYSIVRKINTRTQIQIEWLTALHVHRMNYIISILRERKLTDYSIVRKIHTCTNNLSLS